MSTQYKFVEYNNEITQTDKQGKNKLYKDKEALNEFLRYINDNTRQYSDEVTRVRELTKQGLYDTIFNEVPDEVIKEFTELAYSFKFEFQSFMACKKFYDSYAVLDYDKDKKVVYVENYEQHNVRVALYLFRNNYEKAKQLLEFLMRQLYQPATPTFLNSGVGRRGELSSCYLFMVDDNIESMNFIENSVKQASKNAGGVAVDLTRIRPRGATVNGIPNASQGVIPYAKAIEQGVSHFNQGGKRQGSAAGYLNVFHLDIFDLLSSKKINASEKVRLDTLSIGVTIPNKFMELLKDGESFYTFDTYDIHKEYGQYLDEIDFDTQYEDLVNNPNIRKKKHSARDLMTDIAKTQLESGYPYVFYIDNANDNHPLKELGKVKMSNLCKYLHL